VKRVNKACLGLAVVLAAALVAAPATSAAAAGYERLTPQTDASVPVRDAGEGDGPVPSTEKPFTAPAPKWPAAATADVALGATAARAGELPVSVSSVGGTQATVRVQVLDRKTTEKSGVDGLLMRVGRADGRTEQSQVRLSVDYNGFRYAHGADWASRLRLVSVPECVLTTPKDAECRVTPLVSDNNIAKGTVTADTAVTGGLVALAAAPAGPSGDYSASPLQPSSTWSAGNNAGSFGWSYPMRVPPAINGPGPAIGLSYSSSSVDGRMAASNNQPSTVGEGFDFSSGFIERRYTSCAKDGGTAPSGVGDLCWKTDNAVLSLNGRSTELIKAADGTWHGRTEDGSKITRSTSSTNGNGDNDGEHWVVTTTDGTQYWFGRNRLPGWETGKDETNSTWTVRVFANQSTEDCYKATFALAHCLQAWRWNLDYVVDPFGNTMSYWYAKEGNKYAMALNASAPEDYTRGGYLTRIDYGTRGNTAYGTAPTQVVLTPGDRCLSSCGTKNATNWPDTPWDQECTAAPCLVGSPTFWTSKRLAKVTTRVRSGSGYRDVESWTLTHSFPNPGDGTRAGLWLEKIGHVGRPTDDPTAMPDITFVGTQKANRVDATDHSPAMNWRRISHINTESGGSISVTYSDVDCVKGSRMPDPNALQNNTLRCYPVRWQPPGQTSPIWDYFHKYLVTAVTETDLALPSDGRSPRMLTTYEYLDDPAWHYTDDDGLVDDASKTWSVWRGYSRVRVTQGEGAERTRGETRYFRGMHGDKLPSGTRSVVLAAVGGAPAVNDEDEFAGMPREEIVYDGPTTGEVSGTVSEPWRSSETATRTIDGVTVKARFVKVGAVRNRTTLDGGRQPRRTSSATTFDAYGMVVRQEDFGDEAVIGDETCAVTTYARNTSAWLMEFPSREQSFATSCARAALSGLTEDEIVGDTYTSYDQQARGVAPSKGAVSKVEELNIWPSTYLTTAKATHDAHGRVKEAWDARGNKTTTTYTPETGGPVTSVSTVNHLNWNTTTTLDPAWGVPTATKDANGKITNLAYDGLGRTTAVWLPGTATTQTANQTFAYEVYRDRATVVTSARLTSSGGYVTSYTLYDGHLRPRQTQTSDGGTGRVLTDTFYDTAGRVVKTNNAYVADGAPAKTLALPLPEAQVPSQNRTTYDGAGRPTASIFLAKDVEKWRTTKTYGGDRVDTVPPQGAFAGSSFTDAQGRTTRLRQYELGVGGSGYDDTTFTYDRKGQLTEVADTAGNKWTYDYDFRGRQTTVDDPDKGETTLSYNEVGDLTTTTDARGEKLAYVYDGLGRRTAVHDDTPTGAKHTAWTYDNVAKGQQDSAIRYVGTAAYTDEVTGYDDGYRPTGRTVTIPTTETGLAGEYAYTYTYNIDGSLATAKLPAVGGLPSEKLLYGYDDVTGRPNTLRTNASSTGDDTFIINGTSYTRYGELAVIGHRHDDGKVLDTGRYYEEGTRRLSRILTTRETNPSLVSDVNYTRDPAGNVTQVSDVAVNDTQCFRYDHLSRLLQAWTPTSQNCADNPTQASLGGPGPYWQSFTYDDVGNRLTATERSTSTTTARTYTYPSAGAAQPHAPTSVKVGATTYAYDYDESGNTLAQQGLTATWDAEGHMATASDGSSYVYGADGNRLIKRDSGGQTLYLPDGQELRSSGVGTRYYSHVGQVVGMRSSSGVVWLIADNQGTAQASVKATDQAVTTRRQTPFGNPRPGAQPTWPNDKGFVGGTKDNSGLVHLGAREYDPANGRFLSVDPMIDHTNPQQMHGYSYASNSPVTYSDPSGLVLIGDDYGLVKAVEQSDGSTKVVDNRSYSQLREQQRRQGTGNFPWGNLGRKTTHTPVKPPPPPTPKPKPSVFNVPRMCAHPFVEINCWNVPRKPSKASEAPAPRCSRNGSSAWSSPATCEDRWAQYDAEMANPVKYPKYRHCQTLPDCPSFTVYPDEPLGDLIGPKAPASTPAPKGLGLSWQAFISWEGCLAICVGFSGTSDGIQVTVGRGIGKGLKGFGVTSSVGITGVPARDQASDTFQACAAYVAGGCAITGTTKAGERWYGGALQMGVGIGVGGQRSYSLVDF
jgi:RHS repeat-associated protein